MYRPIVRTACRRHTCRCRMGCAAGCVQGDASDNPERSPSQGMTPSPGGATHRQAAEGVRRPGTAPVQRPVMLPAPPRPRRANWFAPTARSRRLPRACPPTSSAPSSDHSAPRRSSTPARVLQRQRVRRAAQRRHGQHLTGWLVRRRTGDATVRINLDGPTLPAGAYLAITRSEPVARQR